MKLQVIGSVPYTRRVLGSPGGTHCKLLMTETFSTSKKKRNLERDQHFLVAHFLLDNSKGISVKCLMLNTGGKFI